MTDKTHNPARTMLRDLAVALFFLAWAGVGWASILSNPVLFSDRYAGLDPGPALMPVIVLSVLTAGGLLLAAKPLVALLGAVPKAFVAKALARDDDEAPGIRLPLAFFVSVAAFPLAMTAIGYLATTALFVFGWSFALTPDALRKPLRTAAIATVAAVVVTLIIHVGFDLVIRVRLP